jgi:hypothetical protein
MVDDETRTATLADTASEPSASKWGAERIALFAVLGLLAIGLIAALIFLGNTLAGGSGNDRKHGGHNKPGAAAVGSTPTQQSPSPTQAQTGTIPTDLVGQSGKDAEKELQSSGFTSVSQAEATNYIASFDQGVVVATDPTAGTTVALTRSVTLFVNPPAPAPAPTPGSDKKPPGKGKDKAKGHHKGHD